MEINNVKIAWRYCTLLIIFVSLILLIPSPWYLSAEDNAVTSIPADTDTPTDKASASDGTNTLITIESADALSSLLELTPNITHTVKFLFELNTDAFRQIKVIFPKITALIHLDLSGCTLASNTVSLGGTFKDCPCLVSVIVPDGILYTGDEVFMGCINLQTVQLPDSLQIIFSSAFSGCSSLESISIPAKVTTIGKNAFLNCSRLTTIVLPEKVSGIGTGAFSGCSLLQDIVITSKSRKYTYVSGMLFEQVPGGKALHTYVKTGTVPVIPPDVTSILERAFYNNNILYSVIIPENIVTIGDEAFAFCSAMISVEIPSSVSFAGRDVFKGCTSLQEIVMRKMRKVPSGWDKSWIGDLLYGIIKWQP